MDIIEIEARRSLPEKIIQRFSFGDGMNTVLSEENADQLLSNTIPVDEADEASFKLDTIAIAEEGKQIKIEDLNKIIEEAKAKGVTVASLIHKLPNARTQVIVSPGPGVVNQAPRTGRKKKE